MSTPDKQRPSRRSISCPACKKEQPFAHTCASCGFDIKAHAMRVMRERAEKKTQKSSTPEKPGPVPAPVPKNPVKRKDIICPSCSAIQPFTYTCISCGFDIKGFVLQLKRQGPQKAAFGREITPKPEFQPSPVIGDPQPLPPELFAETERAILDLFRRDQRDIDAEREIMSLFVAEVLDTREELPGETSAERDDSVLHKPADAAPSAQEEPAFAGVDHSPEMSGEIQPETELEQPFREKEAVIESEIEETADPEIIAAPPEEEEHHVPEKLEENLVPLNVLADTEALMERVVDELSEVKAPVEPDTGAIEIEEAVEDLESLVEQVVDEILEAPPLTAPDAVSMEREPSEPETGTTEQEDTSPDKEILVEQIVTEVFEEQASAEPDANHETRPAISDAFSEDAFSQVLNELDDAVFDETELPLRESDRQQESAPSLDIEPHDIESETPVEESEQEYSPSAFEPEPTASQHANEKDDVPADDGIQVEPEEEPELPSESIDEEPQLESEEEPVLQTAELETEQPPQRQETPEDEQSPATDEGAEESSPEPEPVLEPETVTVSEAEETSVPPIEEEPQPEPKPADAPEIELPTESVVEEEPQLESEKEPVLQTAGLETEQPPRQEEVLENEQPSHSDEAFEDPSPESEIETEPETVTMPEIDEPDVSATGEDPQPEPEPANTPDSELPTVSVDEEGPQVEPEEEPVPLAAKSAVEHTSVIEEYQAPDENDIPRLVSVQSSAVDEMEASSASVTTKRETDAPVMDEALPMPEQPAPALVPLTESPSELPAKPKKTDRSHRPAHPKQKKIPRPAPKPVPVRRTPPPPPPALYPERQTPGPAELLSPKALVRSAWEDYKKRAPLLTVLWLVALAGAAVPLGVALGLGFLIAWIVPGLEQHVLTVAGIAGIPVALTGMSPGLGALIAAVADPAADRYVALYRGKRLWRSTAIVLLAAAGIATGGSVLFIVPGLLVAVGAGLALYVAFIERETGLVALIKSFEYLKGRSVDSMLKLSPAAVLFIVPAVLFRIFPPLGIFALLVLLLCLPFLIVYLHCMFENLRGMKGRIIFFRVSRNILMRWTAAALAGASVPLILALLLWRLGQASNAFHLLASLI